MGEIIRRLAYKKIILSIAVIVGSFFLFQNCGASKNDGTLISDQILETPIETSKIATDYDTWCTIAEGKVLCLGANDVGQIGDGSTTDRKVPTAAIGITDAEQVAVGYHFTCALTKTNSAQKIFCWGASGSSQVDNTPVEITTAMSDNVVQIAAGLGRFCTLYRTGLVACVDTDSGPMSSWAFKTITGIGNVASIAVREKTLYAVTRDGQTYADPSYQMASTVNFSNISQIGPGILHECAVTKNRTVECRGLNEHGQLGNGVFGTGIKSLEPVQVKALNKVVAVTSGLSFSCALTVAGEVMCWGDNSLGQLGIPLSNSKSLSPVKVPDVKKVVSIVAAIRSVCAVTSNDEAICWGSDITNLLGVNNAPHTFNFK